MKCIQKPLPKLPPRKQAAHKGDFGHVLIAGGSRGMSGAVVLAARAALAGGAGLVTSAVPEAIADIVDAQVTCGMTISVDCTSKGGFSTRALSGLSAHIKRFRCILIGPGMGQTTESTSFVSGLLEIIEAPCVVDADGLNALVNQPEPFASCSAPLVITPHPGEMARLLGCAVSKVQAQRAQTAVDYAAKHGCVVLLKGAETVIAHPEGHYALNQTGNPGMATAGSGDVLGGIITALLAQGLGAWEAARLGAHFHGLAGDLGAEKLGQPSLTALDILACLPTAMMQHATAS